MIRWLETRPRRERRLLALAGLLLVVAVLWLGLYRPLAQYRTQSERAWTAASERLAEVEALAAEIVVRRRRERKNEAPSGDRPIRSVVSETARRHGLTLSRLAPESNARLGVWFESAEAPALFRWVEMLEDRFGIEVAKASIATNADGPTIRAQLTLARPEPAT